MKSINAPFTHNTSFRKSSKQARVTSWADSATAHDRLKAVEDLLRKEGLISRYANTTTMKGKTGISPFAIVEFFTKEARKYEQEGHACSSAMAKSP